MLPSDQSQDSHQTIVHN